MIFATLFGLRPQSATTLRSQTWCLGIQFEVHVQAGERKVANRGRAEKLAWFPPLSADHTHTHTHTQAHREIRGKNAGLVLHDCSLVIWELVGQKQLLQLQLERAQNRNKAQIVVCNCALLIHINTHSHTHTHRRLTCCCVRRIPLHTCRRSLAVQIKSDIRATLNEY